MNRKTMNRKTMSRLVKRLLDTYEDERGINHIEGRPVPDREAILNAMDRLFFVIFPGFTNGRPVSRSSIEYMVGDALGEAFEILVEQVEIALCYQCKREKRPDCDCSDRAGAMTRHLFDSLPRLREILKTDVQAAFDGDPAATSPDEIILSYPGIRAIALHRIAHELYTAEVPLIPRLVAEHAHGLTGIDIHPGATIGESFFIDHGTGVVIGETTEIGARVKIYMGVTLGAMAPAAGQSLRGRKRHPTLEDDVTIYAGATILGGETVIGKGSTVGGNVWLTESVPASTKVLLSSPELVFIGRNAKTARSGNAKKKKTRKRTGTKRA